MEPQGLGCGVFQPQPQDLRRQFASMEPQGLGCGVSPHKFRDPSQLELQWSHRV